MYQRSSACKKIKKFNTLFQFFCLYGIKNIKHLRKSKHQVLIQALILAIIPLCELHSVIQFITVIKLDCTSNPCRKMHACFVLWRLFAFGSWINLYAKRRKVENLLRSFKHLRRSIRINLAKSVMILNFINFSFLLSIAFLLTAFAITFIRNKHVRENWFSSLILKINYEISDTLKVVLCIWHFF